MTIAQSTVTSRVYSATRVIDWRNLPVMLVLGIGAIFMLLPFLWMFATSMRPASEAYQLPPSFLPTRLNFDAYAAVLNSPLPFLRMYLNSFIVACLLITSLDVSYAVCRSRWSPYH